MPAAPTLTALVATRDRPALLRDALASVAAQSRAPLEVRIGDDGDVPPLDVLADLPGLEITVVPARTGQAGATRNAAAAGARGDVLAFLDDDDRWREGHLERLARAFADPDVRIAFADVEIVRERVDAGGARTTIETRTIAREWDDVLMRSDAFVAPSALAIRREFFEALGGFDPGFRYSEDWDLLLRAARTSVPRRVPGIGAEVRLRESGNSSADFGPERRACLARLAARHGLAPLEPKTFWEVAAVVATAP